MAKITLSLGLALYVLVFSSGFSIYSHYCLKANEGLVSLVAINEHCSTPSAQEPTSSCCSHAANVEAEGDIAVCAIEPSCCAMDVKHIQLKPDYTQEITTDFACTPAEAYLVLSVLEVESQSRAVSSVSTQEKKIPPLIHSGRTISISHQLFLC